MVKKKKEKNGKQVRVQMTSKQTIGQQALKPLFHIVVDRFKKF